MKIGISSYGPIWTVGIIRIRIREMNPLCSWVVDFRDQFVLRDFESKVERKTEAVLARTSTRQGGSVLSGE